MTIIYDPNHEAYRDEADMRHELARVHDICHGCRRCIDHCPSFPTLFDLLDAHEEPDALLLTPAQQDEVVDACFQCTSCVPACPYQPGVDAAAVDMPRLMLRAKAVQFDNGHVGTRPRPGVRVLGRTEGLGRLATRFPSVVNRLLSAAPGSRTRKLLTRISGLSAERRLPMFASQRFSTWFAERPRVHVRRPNAEVSVVPTCLVEYQVPEIGRDIVRVYERNGIECSLSSAQCCGAPLLHAGDVTGFAKVASENVAALAAEIRTGREVVVGQPTCAHVIRTSYVGAVDDGARDDARMVAAHTSDATDFLMQRHRSDGYVIDTDFGGRVPGRVAYHTSGHLRAVEDGVAGRDILKLTGARVRPIRRSSGCESIWDLRAGHDDVAADMGSRLGAEIERADSDVVAGDCHLSNVAIEEHTGRPVVHPLQLVARAYGIADDG